MSDDDFSLVPVENQLRCIAFGPLDDLIAIGLKLLPYLDGTRFVIVMAGSADRAEEQLLRTLLDGKEEPGSGRIHEVIGRKLPERNMLQLFRLKYHRRCAPVD